MNPERIILIKHGKSKANVNHDIISYKPDYAPELTEEGLIQAREEGKKLPVDFYRERCKRKIHS
jgi:broad specificity phosphatase PhoE